MSYLRGSIELSTPDRLEYQYFPARDNVVKFHIKAPNDAHIALTTTPYSSDPMYEVFIGGWSNTKSIIRKNRKKPDVTETQTPYILSAREFHGFWIGWNGNTISAGKEGVQEPFLIYTDRDPIHISHFGVRTGWKASGEWKIEANSPIGSHGGTHAPGWISRSSVHFNQHSWVDCANDYIPPGAFVGGNEDGPLYVGRAIHEGSLTPGKVKPSHGVCYVPWGGKEHAKTYYQVLVGHNMHWVSASGGNFLRYAICAGRTEDGEQLFVGRADHNGTLTVGKVQRSHNKLYIPYGGEEIPISNYEVLVSY